MTAAQALFTWAPPARLAFGTAGLGMAEVALCPGAGAAMLLLVEQEKALRRARL